MAAGRTKRLLLRPRFSGLRRFVFGGSMSITLLLIRGNNTAAFSWNISSMVCSREQSSEADAKSPTEEPN